MAIQTEGGKEIVLITWDKPIYQMAEQVLRNGHSDCGLAYTTQETLEEDSQRLERLGAKIFIAFGVAGKFIRQAVNCPVIALHMNEEDIYQALIQASGMGKKIAILGYSKTMKPLARLQPLFNIQLAWEPNPPISQIPEAIQKLSDADIFIGGDYQTHLAKQYGMKTLTLRPREEAIVQAIETARSFLSADQAENQSRTRSSIYAVMTVQPDGTLVVLNKLASEYLGLHPLSVTPHTIAEV